MQKRCRIISLVVFLLVEFMMPISYASENSEEDFSLEENVEAVASEEESNSEGDGSPEVIDENLGEETEDEPVEDEIKEEKEEIKETVEDSTDEKAKTDGNNTVLDPSLIFHGEEAPTPSSPFPEGEEDGLEQKSQEKTAGNSATEQAKTSTDNTVLDYFFQTVGEEGDILTSSSFSGGKDNLEQTAKEGETKSPYNDGDDEEDGDEDPLPDDEDKVKQELEKARETLNPTSIIGEETFDELGITVKVKALSGTFPENTQPEITLIQGTEKENVEQQIINDTGTNISEEAEMITFNIKFIYTLKNGSGVEVQPLDNKVEVTFDYADNDELKETSQEEIEIYHINDKDENGEKVAEGEEKVETIDINEQKSDKVENGLVIDAESFSYYTIVVQRREESPESAPTQTWQYGEDYFTINIARPSGFSSTDYPIEGFTIMDRNLGASISGTTCNTTNATGACGYLYQWGNNYGFPISANASSILTGVGLTWDDSYNNNGYVSKKFIKGSSFAYDVWSDRSHHDGVWGGANDVNYASTKNSNGLYWDDGGDRTLRQGPCPEGWHVPSAGEWSMLLDYWYYTKYNTHPSVNGNLYFISNSTRKQAFMDYFYLPSAGYRDSSNASFGYRGSYGFYWSSSPLGASSYGARALGQDSSRVGASYSDGYRADGFSVRCFKDGESYTYTVIFDSQGGTEIENIEVEENSAIMQPINPTKDGYVFSGWYLSGTDTLWNFETDVVTEDMTLYAKWFQPGISYADNVTTYVDTEGNEFSMGTITYTDTGGNSITILDRNLGATGRGTGENAYGYHFQWGNNFGFPNNITPKTSSTKVNTSNYSWTNPYISDVFIKDSAGWETNTTSSLWGGNGEYDYMRQGPCPAGYHVPTLTEISTLYSLFGNNATTINENLYIPYGGIRNKNNAEVPVDYLGTNAYLWSSTIYANLSSYYYKFNKWEQFSNTVDARSYGFSVRCFADTTPNEVILSFETNGGQKIQGQTVPQNGTAHVIGYDPEKTGYTFAGWYKDSELIQPFQFGVDVLIEDTTIYAKWNKPRCQNQGTQYSGVVWNCEEGTITVTNGSQSITMKDMNVGATTVGYGENAAIASYGLYYQWGGMTGYDYSLTANQAKNLGFVTNNNTWSSLTSGWTKEQQTQICGEGYHIPTSTEMQSVIDMYISNRNSKNNFYKAFKIPIAGWREYDDATMRILYNGYKYSDLWTNTSNGNNRAYNLELYSGDAYVYNNWERAYGYNIRCFKDSQNYTVTFDSQGGTEVENIEVEENSTITKPANPTKGGFMFSGWYISGTDTLWNFETDVVTEDITLYAKWKNNEPLSVSAPSLITFPNITVPRIVMAVDVNVNDYFSVKDPIGSESGWRITIEATDLSGSLSVIDKSNIYLKAGALETVGELNEAVHINQNLIDDFVSLGTPINYIYRTTTTNHKTGEYRDKPTVRVRVPAYQPADTYSGKIVVTLYEN